MIALPAKSLSTCISTAWWPRRKPVSRCGSMALAMNCGKLKAKNSDFFIPPKYEKSLGNQAKTRQKMLQICRVFQANTMCFFNPLYAQRNRQKIVNFKIVQGHNYPLYLPFANIEYPLISSTIFTTMKRFRLLAAFFGTVFLSAVPSLAQTNIIVAADGSGQFKSVQDAIMSIPSGSAADPVIIHIKPGIYHETIYIQREKSFFHLIGADAARTVITFNLYAGMTNVDGKPLGTFKTPTATIDADNFTAENLTFENSAGPVGQAVAIRVDGDHAMFRHCRFLGWQDTMLLNRGHEYFRDCYIAGHVDFIFGAATAWFENCQIHCLRNGYITAASTPQDQPFGFVFSHCQINSEDEVKTYLGRPWRIYASVIWLDCQMSVVVRPEGWYDWKKPEAHSTVRYAEFNSTGPGANPLARVPWSKQLTATEAGEITIEKVLGPDNEAIGG
jgi:pectinesterase